MANILTSAATNNDNKTSEYFLQALMSQVNEESIAKIIELQKNSLMRFEKTNEMLANCCSLSANRLEKAKKDLNDSKQLILEMKSDLDSIFRRIRNFRNNYKSKYVDIQKHFEEQYCDLDEDT
ncbi:unnamed protein product [Thelazia callipaeda]|uniref:KxDL domain-containing protein n=1 Tax=Thelazia callipaeda TaxID=103827 RepID=A0A0N5CP04_THECL|nr:unnamed protein product [Thelazia callipaeda]